MFVDTVVDNWLCNMQMADIPDLTTTDPHLMLSVGRRHLAVRDYPSAVETLGRACELLGQMFGLQSDECGEAYLWYGKSLLGLAREESGVLGDGIPQGGEDSPDDKDDDGEAVDEDNNEDGDENGDEEKSDTEKGEEKDEEMEVEKEKPAKSEEKSAKDEVKPTEGEAEKPATDEKEESDKAAEGGEKSEAAGSSKKEPAAEPQDSDEEDDVESLQLAWEILELAKDIFLRRGEDGRKDLADVYLQLGEVSLESETYDKAISDMGKSLELFKELYSADDRRIAETHYQIGLAHSLSNGFEDAITHFRTAAEILQARIVNLESPGAEDDPNVKKYLATDPFYSISGETKELRELLPQIQEKIQDMMDYKAEAIKSVRESLGLSTNGQSDGKPTSATNGSDAAEAKPEEKKAVDISHLVKRKRKPSEENKMEAPSAKKPAN